MKIIEFFLNLFNTILTSSYNTLLYLTNNEDLPKKEWLKDEKLFDIIFFITCTLLLIIGLICIILYIKNKTDFYLGIMFACEFLLCFVWVWDNIRHNREDD